MAPCLSKVSLHCHMENGCFGKPCSHFTHDRLTLLSIFPAEVWSLCFSQLEKHPQVLQNVTNTSPFLRDLLYSRKNYFLFPLVWPLLSQQLDPPSKSEATLDHIKSCVSTILRCRTVCQSWCQAVDSFYRDHPQHSWPRRPKTHSNALSLLSEVSVGPQWPSPFMEHFKASHSQSFRSPLVSNSLDLCVRHEDAANRVFLNTYGNHIWHCRVYLFGVNLYDALREVLWRMPNLRSLNLLLLAGNFRALDAELEREIRRKPLPTFIHLVSFKSSGLPDPILTELIQKNRHVQSLKVGPFAKLFPAIEFPKLRYLSLDANSPDVMRQLRCGNKLKAAKLNFSQATDMGWMAIFNLLEQRLADTVATVRLSLPEMPAEVMKRVTQNLGFRLELPRVKRLTLRLQSWTCLDFLLPMRKTLEYLFVNVSKDNIVDLEEIWFTQPNVEEETSPYFTTTENVELKENSIWELFPGLQEIKLKEVMGGNIKTFESTRKQWKLQKDNMITTKPLELDLRLVMGDSQSSLL